MFVFWKTLCTYWMNDLFWKLRTKQNYKKSFIIAKWNFGIWQGLCKYESLCENLPNSEFFLCTFSRSQSKYAGLQSKLKTWIFFMQLVCLQSSISTTCWRFQWLAIHLDNCKQISHKVVYIYFITCFRHYLWCLWLSHLI